MFIVRYLVVLLFGVALGGGGAWYYFNGELGGRDRELRISDANNRILGETIDRIGDGYSRLESGFKSIGEGIKSAAGIVHESKDLAANGKDALRKSIENFKRITEAVRLLEASYSDLCGKLGLEPDVYNPGLDYPKPVPP